MTEPKVLTGSSSLVWGEESEEPMTFDFSGANELHIMSCMPVQIESAFWRRLLPESA